MRVRWQALALIVASVTLAGCGSGASGPPPTPTPNVQATANAIIFNAHATATAIAAAAVTEQAAVVATETEQARVVATATLPPPTAAATPRAHATATPHPGKSPTITPVMGEATPTATPNTVINSSGSWQISAHRVKSAPSVHKGWTDLSFRLVVTNVGRDLLDLSQLNLQGSMQSTWKVNVYHGPIHVPAVMLPPSYSVEGSGQVEVPTAPLLKNEASFAVITPAGPVAIPFAAAYGPEPALPTTSTDQRQEGETVSLSNIADITVTGQAIGSFYPYGKLSSNWELKLTWTNESGHDSALTPVVRVMQGNQIFDAVVSSTSQPPLQTGTAVIHLPLLARGPHYLVISSPGSADFGLYRISPTVAAETWSVSDATRSLYATGVPAGDLWSSVFQNPSDGWLVGQHGVLLYTKNGGASWSAQQTGTKVDLYAIAFPEKSNGWAVGNGGTILHTSDGMRWAVSPSGTTAYLARLAFADPMHGWVVGQHGTLLFTRDGGYTWNSKSGGGGRPLTPADLSGVAFPDLSDIWAVGNSGVIQHSFDGGVSWNPQQSGTSETLNAVSFRDMNHGWVVGNGGVLLSTKNGGKTWTEHARVSFEDLFYVSFSDAQHGWVLGNHGLILRTVNGGAQWSAVTTPVDTYLLGLSFASPSSGWVVGQNGTLLHLQRIGD